MRRTALPDDFPALLDRQASLFSWHQAVSAGLSRHALAHRCRPDGPWQRVLPEVYAACNGPLTGLQRRQAALLYAGPSSMLYGLTAAASLGLRAVPELDAVHVLVPPMGRRSSVGFAQVHVTVRPEEHPVRVGGLRTPSVARAVVDGCRQLSTLRSVRALIAEAVQRGRTSVPRLAEELELGPSAGSALPRRVLTEVAAGVRSAPEAELAQLLRRTKLPEPRWNVDLLDTAGCWLARPDAHWRCPALVLEVDSREWHLDPASWEATMRRHNRLQAAGYAVLHFSPSRIRAKPEAVLAEVEEAYHRMVHSGSGRS